MYHACVPVALNALARAQHLLALAEAADLIQTRMVPHHFSFEEHLGVAASMALRLCFPVAGKAPPELDHLTTVQDKLSCAEAALRSFSEADFEGTDTRIIAHRAGFANLQQIAPDYVNSFAIPNLWFHVSLAYASLRAAGLDIGKTDFDGLHAYPEGFNWV